MRNQIKLLAAAMVTLVLAGCPVSSVPLELEPPATDESESLEQLVERTLRENLARRTLATDTHGAWQILHGILAYGDRFLIETPQGSRPAIEYLLSGGPVDGFEPMRGDSFGDRRGLSMDLQPSTKVGQGHRDQWLAVLTQSGLSPDTEIESRDGTFNLSDWTRQAEFDVPRNLEREFSWTLIALTANHKTDHTWRVWGGGEVGTEDLLASELERDIAASVCGGTHRLIGISMALNKRRTEGAPVSGVWLQAQNTLEQYVALARQNQNADGSYGVAYLHRPGWTRDLGETLGTTGHVLEFLAFAASDETLQQPWVQRSVRRLCQVLRECENIDLECGVLYHALHGLTEYQSRMRSLGHWQDSSPRS